MPDTRRTLSALQALFADNTAGDISAQDGRDEIVSSHPENVIQSGAWSSLPGSGQLTGDLYIPTNSLYLCRWNGSAWTYWFNGITCTLPVDGDYTWTNQGSAAVDASKGHINLSSVGSAAASFRIRRKSAPSTPYTITALFRYLPTAVAQRCGLLFRQSSDGKIASFHVETSGTGGPTISSQKWTNETTFSATYRSNIGGGHFGNFLLRIADDNTNRVCSFSTDGQVWSEFHSVGRTDFLTADQVGFFVDSRDSGSNSTPIQASLLSWVQA